jgi:hypothetical protein
MANNFPNLRPTLNLDLVNGIYVDPRVTFTRAGTRTYYGQEVVKAEENLLLNSATLSTQNVTVTATAYVVSFTGTGTITLSGASTAGPLVGTGVSDRVSLSFTPTAGTLTLTVTGSVTLAQLENRSSLTAYTATTTQTITRYQRQLKTAAANEWPREFDPVTGECLGRSVWESRTNLLLYSEEFDNAYWTKSNVTISTNQIIAPDGTLTADKMVEDATLNQHRIFRAIDGSTKNVSIYAKAAERSYIGLFAAVGTRTYFNLSAGTIGTVSSGSTATIESVGNGWYRCSLYNAHPTNSGLVQLSTDGTTETYTGDGVSGVYIWGADLEAGTFATPYIPTVASTVTRIADSAVITGTNFSSWYNPSEGCFVASALTENTTSSGSALSAEDGTTSNRTQVRINSSSALSLTVVVAGTIQVSMTNGSFAANVYKIGAASYKFNDYAISCDGAAVSTDTTATVPVVNQLVIGGGTSQNSLNGYLKRLTYYPQALTSANLQAVTA